MKNKILVLALVLSAFTLTFVNDKLAEAYTTADGLIQYPLSVTHESATSGFGKIVNYNTTWAWLGPPFSTVHFRLPIPSPQKIYEPGEQMYIDVDYLPDYYVNLYYDFLPIEGEPYQLGGFFLMDPGGSTRFTQPTEKDVCVRSYYGRLTCTYKKLPYAITAPTEPGKYRLYLHGMRIVTGGNILGKIFLTYIDIEVEGDDDTDVLQTSCRANNTTIDVGDTATFTSTVTNATSTVTYDWNNGDGTNSTYSKTYTTEGQYIVNLAIEDENNNTANTSCAVSVCAGGSCGDDDGGGGICTGDDCDDDTNNPDITEFKITSSIANNSCRLSWTTSNTASCTLISSKGADIPNLPTTADNYSINAGSYQLQCTNSDSTLTITSLPLTCTIQNDVREF